MPACFYAKSRKWNALLLEQPLVAIGGSEAVWTSASFTFQPQTLGFFLFYSLT